MIGELPSFVEIDTLQYEVYTDFRDWIHFEQMLKDEKLSKENRFCLMFDWFVDDIPPVSENVMKTLVGFYLCEEENQKSNSTKLCNKIILDYGIDFALIAAGFLQSYGINLYSTEYLHWWEFKALFQGLPEETKLSKIMGYRAMDIGKLPKSEQKKYKELQNHYSLGKLQTNNQPKTKEELDAQWLQKAREERAKAQKGQMS